MMKSLAQMARIALRNVERSKERLRISETGHKDAFPIDEERRTSVVQNAKQRLIFQVAHCYSTAQKFHSFEGALDDTAIGHRGESKFWRDKMRTFHGILDVNKDGVISYDDFQLLAQRFVDLGRLSDTHTTEFRDCITQLWEMLWGEINQYNLITVEQYLEDMHHVLNDKTRIARVHTFLPYLFKAVDKDNSNEISVEEFKLFFECLGLKADDAKVAFMSIDSNNDGKISINEFTSHGRDFFLTEDEERVSKYFWGPLVDD